MYLLELLYIPAIRRFQRYKAINANTVTARTGPTMKYHFTVVVAEKPKQKGTCVSYFRSTENEGHEANKIVLY